MKIGLSVVSCNLHSVHFALEIINIVPYLFEIFENVIVV